MTMELSRRLDSPLPGDVKNRLESVVENTDLLHRQIREGRARSHHGVALDTSVFHVRFFQSAQRVSDACTKLALLFSKPPCPTAEANGVVCGLVEQSTLQLSSTCFQVSPHQGKHFLREVRQATMGILEGASNLVKALIKNGGTGSARLQGTGTVWEKCYSLEKISKDNRAAVVRVFISQLHLLKDARSEVEQLEANNGLGDQVDDGEGGFATFVGNELNSLVAGMALCDRDGGPMEGQSSMDSDEEGPREWNEAEAKLVRPCIRLIQLSSDVVGDACRLVVSHGSVEQEVFIQELDRAADSIQQLSPIVDDLAEALEAPVAVDSCREVGMSLATALQGIVDTISGCHFSRTAGKSWNTENMRRIIFDTVQELQHS